MFEKHFVGLDLTGVQDNGKQRPISRVTFLLDDENSVTAGDDTGAKLLTDCPHATQAMAEAILAKVRGYQYQMFSASDAALDPAAELGDGVTAGGMYSILSRLSEDGSGYADLSAPGETELEDEFPTDGPMTQAFNQKIAKTRSQIIKTAEKIMLLVEDTAKGLSSGFTVELEKITQRVTGAEGSIEATLDLINGFTVTDSSGSTRIKGSSIDTSTIKANSISADKLNLTGAITFSDLNSSTQSSINSAASNASAALTKAALAQDTVDGWVYPNSTYIDGTKIMTGTIQASVLRGGQVDLLSSDGLPAGGIGIYKSGIGSNGVVSIQSDELSLATYNPNGILALGAYGQYAATTLRLWPDGRVEVQGALFPLMDRRYELGLGGLAWMDLYVGNVPIITSDRTKKDDIAYGLDRYGALFDALRPASFRFKDGTSGRTHLGMISQDVEAALEASSLTDMDFAGFIRSPKKDEKGEEIPGEYDYALRYGEFIALCIEQIQKLKARVAKLERRFSA